MDLPAHRAMHGTAASMSAEELAALAEEVDLRGRGGAAFPFARKLRAVMDKRAEKVVLVNAAEGEPASSKDTMLLTRTPHLVIEGALLAAGAINAKRVVIATVKGGMGESSIAAAVEERGVGDRVRVVGIVERFISGEGGAAVVPVGERAGGRAPGRKVRAVESGVNGFPPCCPTPRPSPSSPCSPPWAPSATPTSARPASPGRSCSPWRVRQGPGRGGGRDRHAAVRRAGRVPGLARRGRAARRLSRRVAPPGRRRRGDRLPAGHHRRGGQLGAGIIVPLGTETCPLGETARVARYLAEQSSGQCGPCRLGLPDIARSMSEIVNGSAAALDELRYRAAGVKGRGACFHPDGTSRFVLSALGAFPDDIEEHILTARAAVPSRACSPCPRRRATPRYRLTVDWTRCQGHGLCAKLAPDLIHLDEHGYPVLSRDAIPWTSFAGWPAEP